jgi:hypothetical protein
VLQTKENQYRAEDLSHLIFHDLNEIRPSPDSLEKFRPMSICKKLAKLL